MSAENFFGALAEGPSPTVWIAAVVLSLTLGGGYVLSRSNSGKQAGLREKKRWKLGWRAWNT